VLPDEYCREVESYLCRKNDGHLIRIVGPSFERVCSWAAQGIPFKIACEGIDRYFVRYYAKPGRRRPVQIDFCENDVLEAFDAWRRAVGVRLPGTDQEVADATAKQRKHSLPEHLDRVCERITNRRAGLNPLPPDYDRALEEVTNEVAIFRDLPSPIRGDTRDRVITRLVELDRMMLNVARVHVDPVALQDMTDEAVEQLRPFRERMPEQTYERALQAAVDNLLRDREKLPVVAFL
jgi:hypothetical protein